MIAIYSETGRGEAAHCRVLRGGDTTSDNPPHADMGSWLLGGGLSLGLCIQRELFFPSSTDPEKLL